MNIRKGNIIMKRKINIFSIILILNTFVKHFIFYLNIYLLFVIQRLLICDIKGPKKREGERE